MVTTVRKDHQAERLRVFAVEARMVVGECLFVDLLLLGGGVHKSCLRVGGVEV
jgi:hypothetical protein